MSKLIFGDTVCANFLTYEVVSKIFRTRAAIYTAVVLARSTGPNRPNCEFWVLLRRFAATAWKRAKTSPRNLARTGLDASTMTMPRLTLPSSLDSFWRKAKWLSSPTYCTPLIWHPVTCSCFQEWNSSWNEAGLIPVRRSRLNRRECLTLAEKDFQEAFQKWRRWDRCPHAGANYFERDGGR
jgi:hypothetical protein